MGVSRWAVLASGRGSNLKALLENDIAPAEVKLVVTNVVGAGALDVAADHGVKTEVIEHKGRPRAEFDQAIADTLRAHDIEWVVLAGFMRIIGAPLLQAYGGRIINVHPSLLPSFPGLKAQRQALEAKVAVSGCTVHTVDAGMDTGPILAQAVVPVHAQDTEAQLAQRILRQEHRLLPAVVQALASGVAPKGENEFLVSYGGMQA